MPKVKFNNLSLFPSETRFYDGDVEYHGDSIVIEESGRFYRIFYSSIVEIVGDSRQDVGIQPKPVTPNDTNRKPAASQCRKQRKK